jgi:hypothetical protein
MGIRLDTNDVDIWHNKGVILSCLVALQKPMQLSPRRGAGVYGLIQAPNSVLSSQEEVRLKDEGSSGPKMMG